MTKKTLLEVAKSWDFAVRINNENSWQILPKISTQIWTLTQTESRWILSVRNVPQLMLNQQEAIAFLKSQHSPNN